MTALKQIFAEKLLKTDSLDEALKKVCWVAYQSKAEWISVEDRLPGEQQWCLCVFKSEWQFVCRFIDGIFCWYNVDEDSFMPISGSLTKSFGVTHWMPLPEPPKASD